MANTLKGRVWVLDTPSATPVVTTRIRIARIYWKDPVTIGDALTIVDTTAAANPILSARCEVADQSQIFQMHAAGEWFEGLTMTALSSGKVYVYLL